MNMEVESGVVGKSDYKEYLEKGLSYASYKQNMAKDLTSNPDMKIREYISLNQRRMHRVEKTYTPTSEIKLQVNNLKHRTYWLILTEHWCGDASQICQS